MILTFDAEIPIETTAHNPIHFLDVDTIIATCCTVFAVQIFLGIVALLLLIWKGNPISRAFRSGAKLLTKNDYVRLYSTWLLSVFVLTPYIVFINIILFQDVPRFYFRLEMGFPIFIILVLFASVPKLRRWISKEHIICIMLHLAFSAIIGYHVYYLFWDTTIIQGISCADSALTQFRGLDYLFSSGILYLLITIIPCIIINIAIAVKKKKNLYLNKENTAP